MSVYFHKLSFIGIVLAGFFISTCVFAAKPIDLRFQEAAILSSFSSQGVGVEKLQESQDFKGIKHTRLRQTYQGYPVWGADAVIHVQAQTTTVNGVFYQGLQNDLTHTPPYLFLDAQKQLALQQALMLWQNKTGDQVKIESSNVSVIVYVDDESMAHWAFLVDFWVVGHRQHPMVILDALSFALYQMWDDVKAERVAGGGLGGNVKMGQLRYDGLAADLPALDMLRDKKAGLCYLRNKDVSVLDARSRGLIINFKCVEKSTDNNLYWDADFDAMNGAFSPANDALFIGKMVKAMYRQWYGIPVLTKNGKPMLLKMLVHEDMENAYWNGYVMAFGDGGKLFYPLVSLGVGAHEISHGFTEQHSNLIYFGQSGGLNESFSDMAAKAAEFFTLGKNSWEMGSEIMKEKGASLRYLDEPTKDCLPGDHPGDDCSINSVKDYREGIDVHFSSGVFNKMFFLLSTSSGWDTHKAFNVMEKANANYWTSSENFRSAACGVLDATKDYGYDKRDVLKALEGVGIKSLKC